MIYGSARGIICCRFVFVFCSSIQCDIRSRTQSQFSWSHMCGSKQGTVSASPRTGADVKHAPACDVESVAEATPRHRGLIQHTCVIIARCVMCEAAHEHGNMHTCSLTTRPTRFRNMTCQRSQCLSLWDRTIDHGREYTVVCDGMAIYTHGHHLRLLECHTKPTRHVLSIGLQRDKEKRAT